MSTKRNFMTAELFGHRVKNVLSRLAMVAYAAEDDGDDDDDVKGKGTVPPTINYEQLIATARKEEKDKLYPRIKKAEDEAKQTLASLNTALLENGTLKAEVERLKGEAKKVADGGDTKEVIDLKAKVATLEADLATAKEGGADEATIRAQVEKEYAVKYYRDQKIGENREAILEVFDELVTGATNEEVDKSIEAAIEKSKSVKKQLGIEDPDDEEGEEDTPPTPPAKKTKTPPAPAAKKQPPVGNPAQKPHKDEVSADDILNMDVRSPEYAELRKKLGLK